MTHAEVTQLIAETDALFDGLLDNIANAKERLAYLNGGLDEMKRMEALYGKSIAR